MRMRWGSSPRAWAISKRSRNGAWVETTMVSRPEGASRARPFGGSRNTWSWEGVTNRPSTTTSQPARAAAASPFSISPWASRLPPSRPGCTRGAPGDRAFSGSNTAGSGSKATSTTASPAARAAWFSATTRATGSPWWRTCPPHRTGWSLCTMPCRLVPGTSTRVSTAMTPGTARAAAVSRRMMRPWGMPARLTPAHKQPGGVASAA